MSVCYTSVLLGFISVAEIRYEIGPAVTLPLAAKKVLKTRQKHMIRYWGVTGLYEGYMGQ